MTYLEQRLSRAFAIVLVVFSFGCYSPKISQSACEICGEYRSYVSDSMLYQILSLRSDNSFDYERGSDLISKKMKGSWEIRQDTLLLINKFKLKNYSLQVKEYSRDTIFVDFGLAQNIVGDILPNALIAINDSSKPFDLLAQNYRVSKGSIRSFRISIGNDLISSPYYVINRNATHFDIKLPLNQNFESSLLVESVKFLISNEGLYMLPLDSNFNGNNQNINIRLKKVKSIN